MRVIVTRARARPGRSLRGSRRWGTVVECPLIEIERISDEPIDAAAYEWVVVTSPNGADEIARRGSQSAEARSRRAGDRGTAARAWARAPVRSARLSQEGLLTEFPRPAGRVLFAAAENSGAARRRPRRRLRAALRDAAPHARPARRRRRRPRIRLGGTRVAALRRHSPAVSIGPQTTRVAETSA